MGKKTQDIEITAEINEQFVSRVKHDGNHRKLVIDIARELFPDKDPEQVKAALIKYRSAEAQKQRSGWPKRIKDVPEYMQGANATGRRVDYGDKPYQKPHLYMYGGGA